MEDVTDTVFRRILKEVGPPDLLFTEFTSTDGLCSEGRARVEGRLRFEKEEKPLIAQIWGIRPEAFLRVAAEVRERGFDGVDLNMGCPVRKIVAKGACGALIENPRLAAEIVAATKEGAGELPVSVKTRIGLARPKAEDWIAFLLAQGLSALTVHGRTVSQQSKGEADWSAVALAARLRDEAGLVTRIVGNGDVRTPDVFQRRVRETGADGVMIGRGVFENLFVFNAVREAQGGSSTRPTEFARLTPEEKVTLFRRHISLHREAWGNAHGFNPLKKFAKTYLRSFEGAPALVDEVFHTHTHDQAQAVIDAWLERNRALAAQRGLLSPAG
jgi:tRNA-dihydrouridine synthase